jgi:Thioredoxin like C-terminal domain
VVADKRTHYTVPRQLKLNQWGLSGEWTMGEESISPVNKRGKLIYRFHARDLHLIMGAAIPGRINKFRVLIDGKSPGLSHGLDIDSDG